MGGGEKFTLARFRSSLNQKSRQCCSQRAEINGQNSLPTKSYVKGKSIEGARTVVSVEHSVVCPANESVLRWWFRDKLASLIVDSSLVVRMTSNDATKHAQWTVYVTGTHLKTMSLQCRHIMRLSTQQTPFTYSEC